MKPALVDQDRLMDQALKKALDYEVDESRLQRGIRDRLSRPSPWAGIADRLQEVILLRPGRTTAVGLLTAFVVGFALPLEINRSSEDALMAFALGDVPLVIVYQDARP